MSVRRLFGSVGLTSPWSLELGLAAVALLLGLGVMPILIFYTGAATLGRYEGASLGRLYHTLLVGLGQASIASWVVFLGPYGLYLLFRGLGAWWRGGARSPT
jgi:hypothetical protein